MNDPCTAPVVIGCNCECARCDVGYHCHNEDKGCGS